MRNDIKEMGGMTGMSIVMIGIILIVVFLLLLIIGGIIAVVIIVSNKKERENRTNAPSRRDE